MRELVEKCQILYHMTGKFLSWIHARERGRDVQVSLLCKTAHDIEKLAHQICQDVCEKDLTR